MSIKYSQTLHFSQIFRCIPFRLNLWRFHWKTVALTSKMSVGIVFFEASLLLLLIGRGSCQAAAVVSPPDGDQRYPLMYKPAWGPVAGLFGMTELAAPSAAEVTTVAPEKKVRGEIPNPFANVLWFYYFYTCYCNGITVRLHGTVTAPALANISENKKKFLEKNIKFWNSNDSAVMRKWRIWLEMKISKIRRRLRFSSFLKFFEILFKIFLKY